MFKKVLCYGLTVCCIFLSSCTSFNDSNFENEYKTNYNNINTFINNYFWFDNGNVYYGSDGFYNTRWFCKNNESDKKLFTQYDFLRKNNCEEGQFNNSLQAYGDNVYTWFSTNDENIFYKYDKQTKTTEEIIRVNQSVHLWAVKDEFLIYSLYESEFNIVLYVYNFNSKESKTIAEDVLGFGVVGNNIRYIVYNPSTNSNQIYQYNINDGKNESIGSYFELAGISEETLTFNFTKNKIVFYSDEKPKNLYVLNTNTFKTSEYTLPYSVQFISCYDEYAFITLYDKEDLSLIIHINLENGEYKTIKEKIQCELINSINDNQAYIITTSDGPITVKVEYFLIDKNGAFEKVL